MSGAVVERATERIAAFRLYVLGRGFLKEHHGHDAGTTRMILMMLVAGTVTWFIPGIDWSGTGCHKPWRVGAH